MEIETKRKPTRRRASEGVVWELDGELHREDGPARILRNGLKEWWQHGKLHRIGGPAIVAGGGLFYYVEGKQHREDGPAVIFKGRHKNEPPQYWLDDEEVNLAEFCERTGRVHFDAVAFARGRMAALAAMDAEALFRWLHPNGIAFNHEPCNKCNEFADKHVCLRCGDEVCEVCAPGGAWAVCLDCKEMDSRPTFKRVVIRADRSPLNRQRWLLQLECGHEEWITSKSRPQRQTMTCQTCKREARS